MTILEMNDIKNEYGLSYAYISSLSGIPVPTVQKVLSGETKHPRYQTLEALSRAFRDLTSALDEKPSYGSSVIREEVPVYRASSGKLSAKKQGEYTVEDWFNWPEDERVELIDGVIYYLNTPKRSHQVLAGEAYRQISNYILDGGGSCRPYISPIGVKLDRDDKTMVEPDVAIVCDPSLEETDAVLYGAPDFVMEVISPSTKSKDYIKKMGKYKNAGVREYWIVDSYDQIVLVYLFGDDDRMHIYPLFDSIPVSIYDGKLTICFEPVRKWLQL